MSASSDPPRPGRRRKPVRRDLMAAAFGHPSRRRIADALAGAPDGLTVAELAGRVDLHPNAVRRHLTTLGAAGAVAGERMAPEGRGRPSIRYRLAGDEVISVKAYQELVRVLALLLAGSAATDEKAHEIGHEQGRTLPRGSGLAAITATLARLGFAPSEVAGASDREAGTLVVDLENCPFRDGVAAPGGEVICSLHRGIVAGMADRAVPGAQLTRFSPADPETAGCRMVIEADQTALGTSAGGLRTDKRRKA